MLIQSLACVTLCFAASNGRTAAAILSHRYGLTLEGRCKHGLTKTVNTDALAQWQVHHLALQREVVPELGTAHDLLAFRADYLDAEVIELEFIVRRRAG